MMRLKKCLIAAGAIGAMFSTPTAHAFEGFYVGLMGGVVVPSNFSSNAKLGEIDLPPLTQVATPIFADIKTKVGGQGMVALGYRNGNIRVEGEFFYARASHNNILVGNRRVPNDTDKLRYKGYTEGFGALANVYFDFTNFISEPHGVGLIPYVGAGVGFANIRNKIDLREVKEVGPASAVQAPRSINFTVSDSAVAFQGIVGLAYYLDSDTSFNIDYRYLATGNLSTMNSSYSHSSLNIGFNFGFYG